jgi:hypothetical protein
VAENIAPPQFNLEFEMKKLTVKKSRLVELNRDQLDQVSRKAPGSTITNCCADSKIITAFGVTPHGSYFRPQAVKLLES